MDINNIFISLRPPVPCSNNYIITKCENEKNDHFPIFVNRPLSLTLLLDNVCLLWMVQNDSFPSIFVNGVILY